MSGKCDVLIVGAGPVGLVSALALAKQGLSVRVLESAPDLILDQRAGSIQPSTLEMFNALGMAETFVERGLISPVYHIRDRETGTVVASFDYDILKSDTPFPYVLQYEQYKVTRDIFSEHSGDFELLFSRKVHRIEQTEEFVTAFANGPNGEETYQASYLIGADGNQSVVRKSQDISFDGFTYPQRFVKIATTFDFSTAFSDLCPRTYFSDTTEWCNLFKVKGDGDGGIWRTVFPSRENESEEQALSDEGIQARLQGLHKKTDPYEVENCAIYYVSQRVAETFVKGRVILAGDAAHVNNPIGGLGLNSGIHDAVNLCERLSHIIKGRAAPDELGIYDRQRRTAATQYVQEQTIRNKQLLEEKDPSIRQSNFASLRRTSETPQLAREFLLRSALFTSLKAAAEIR